MLVRQSQQWLLWSGLPIVSSPDCSSCIFSLKYTNITNTEYPWSGEFPRPSFLCDFHWRVQYINFGAGKERGTTNYTEGFNTSDTLAMLCLAIQWPGRAVSWSLGGWVSEGTWPSLQDAAWKKNDNTSYSGHRLTRMLSRDILLNPTQSPPATNSSPYANAAGWENEVRLSKRQAQAQAG